ncbi:alpha/beta hydrolase family protein [Burkholderia gladioli]|uniref:alpha/beta hydrolase family protein n=1 Tax=Burkholderia gladioli TaxID=28095 RepID=UPI0003AA3974|nr:prolyl oligopeptidase family serine peptidase [Burkholderia gladioli]MBU9172814.1 prolyl oligopeptidase family serine peptidase [Burkholderia gladioli]MBU9382203.1 prolyl oligopeptidase family serine peptidase [Burkholderia gladioli]NHH80075.1 2,6-dihydropseudooxynicotine hydrolase [Burkholderia gladioli]PEH83958.1 alpha/beta hydrolase [Burkholderia gladioli]CAG9206066.1 Alpha/beta hydrolase [Burkholderia gladioli]
MFQYFPTNYVWSLSTMIALTHGGNIGEVDAMCAPLREAALAGDDPGTLAFYEAWKAGADKLIALAEEDQARGHKLSAGDKFGRAGLYYGIAERMQAHGFEARLATYRRSLELFDLGRILSRENCVRVEIPYRDMHLAALYVRAEGLQKGERAPVVVVMNGLDSTKEMLQKSVMGTMFARRGVSALFVDQPGTGEALRLSNLPAVHDSETWAAPIVDWLEQHPEVDPQRIGALGVSLGGYYCPRAVAFEPRFACGAVWGANHDWREVQQARLKREGENPVPHYWKHVQWVFGAKDMDDFLEKASRMHLNGVLDRIRVPFLVTHGENDRQIPLKYAHSTFEQLINSPKKDMFVFSAREGGVEHSSLDNPMNAGNKIADWLAGTLGGSVE